MRRRRRCDASRQARGCGGSPSNHRGVHGFGVAFPARQRDVDEASCSGADPGMKNWEGSTYWEPGCEKPAVTARLPRLPPVPRGYGYPYRASKTENKFENWKKKKKWAGPLLCNPLHIAR
ncbi:hypothetical protein [Oryza sativa Japonica Group]|uniref:Uncharacterized protein n=1 Tax=Oryza sativa subsp. japonica TaxID=39947 RepID=Q5NAL7_ORYSJ|nr:hypothetical protein [Oryza sativa Japonica Group]